MSVIVTFVVVLAATAFALLVIIAPSAIDYHRLSADENATPWYDERWYVAPYFHMMARVHGARDHWKTNQMGSERWLVREFADGTVTFWTVLERDPIEPASSSAS